MLANAPDDLATAITPSGLAEVKKLLTDADEHQKQGRNEEALSAYDEIVRRYGAFDQLSFEVGFALGRRGLLLGRVGRFGEALAALNEAVDRVDGFASAGGLAASLVANVLAGKAFTLLALGREDEALTTCDEVISRFGKASAPEIKEAVRLALLGKAYVEQDGLAESVYEGDVQAMLELLPQLDSTPSMVIKVLMVASVKLGAATVRDWILTSPAADHLLPLTTALEQELGLETRVAQEVDEIAQDIRRDIGELRVAME